MPRYHMFKKERAVDDPDVQKTVLKQGKYTTIALCRGAEPYIVTMNYGYDEPKHALYFHCARRGLKIEFIKQNPAVCATVIEDRGYHMGACEHAYRSVVLWGNMSVIDDPEEKKHGLDILINHLEDHPDIVKKRTLKDDSVVENVGILRLDITEMTCKSGQ